MMTFHCIQYSLWLLCKCGHVHAHQAYLLKMKTFRSEFETLHLYLIEADMLISMKRLDSINIA